MSDNNNKATHKIYYGNGLRQGVDEAEAISMLAALLKLPEERAAGIIRNTGRIIKSGLDEHQARRYFELLDKVGLQVEIRGALADDGASAIETTQMMAAVTPPPEPAGPTAAPPAAPPAPPPDSGDAGFDACAEPREYAVLFHGKAFEYFKIWIVNILLTILTLGIYSAWAKVRNKQYFYGNTQIDGSSFQYTARPMQILIGRLIAFGLFVVYMVINQLFPPAALVLALLFLIFLPWIVIRSLAFNARNSMYRNIRFRFNGGVGEAVMAFLVFPLLAGLTGGLLMPFAWHRQTRFYVNNHSFGTTPFSFEASAGPYFGLLGRLILTGIAAFIPLAIFGVMIGSNTQNAEPLAGLLMLPIMVGFYVLMFAVMEAGLGNLRFNNSHLDEVYFNSRLTVGGMASLYFVNTLGVVLSLGLLIPWAKVRTAAYRARCLTLVAPGLDGFIAGEEEKVSALGEQIGEVFDVDILGL